MLPRLFATHFANRFAARSSTAADDTLERALITTGVTFATTRQRRAIGVALIAVGAALAWRRRRAARR